MRPSAKEMRAFLKAAGWVNDPAQGRWQWRSLKFPWAWYVLQDAYSLALSLQRNCIPGKRIAANGK